MMGTADKNCLVGETGVEIVEITCGRFREHSDNHC